MKCQKLFLALIALFLISCETRIKDNTSIQSISKAECGGDADCSTGGCSGQICGEKEKVKGIITTCEWKEEYSCLRLTSCSCINNKCQWRESDEYKKCINKLNIENI